MKHSVRSEMNRKREREERGAELGGGRGVMEEGTYLNGGRGGGATATLTCGKDENVWEV